MTEQQLEAHMIPDCHWPESKDPPYCSLLAGAHVTLDPCRIVRRERRRPSQNQEIWITAEAASSNSPSTVEGTWPRAPLYPGCETGNLI